MDEVEVDGLRIAFERAGQGPPLLLLHGFVGDSREWRQQIEWLSSEFTVVAWDAPGSGRSADPPDSARMPQYADWLAGFIHALALERPHVVGLSFGGALALELYRRHPSIPRTLTLAGGYAGWAGSLSVEATEQRLAFSVQASHLSPAGFVEAMIPSLFSGSASRELIDEFAGIMSGFHPAGFRAMARSLAEADLRDVLPKIEVPTLLLFGNEDARAPLEVAEAIHAAILGSKLVVMQGVGHMSNVEAADSLNRELRVFLRR